MSSNDTSFFVVFVLIALVLGTLFGSFMEQGSMREAAVEHGCGYYDSATGEFGWRKVE